MQFSSLIQMKEVLEAVDNASSSMEYLIKAMLDCIMYSKARE